MIPITWSDIAIGSAAGLAFGVGASIFGGPSPVLVALVCFASGVASGPIGRGAGRRLLQQGMTRAEFGRAAIIVWGSAVTVAIFGYLLGVPPQLAIIGGVAIPCVTLFGTRWWSAK